MVASSLRILTIDDEDMIRETIAVYLENKGYAVLEACNGRQGLERFLAKQIGRAHV